jgi:hypothetical protein
VADVVCDFCCGREAGLGKWEEVDLNGASNWSGVGSPLRDMSGVVDDVLAVGLEVRTVELNGHD